MLKIQSKGILRLNLLSICLKRSLRAHFCQFQKEFFGALMCFALDGLALGIGITFALRTLMSMNKLISTLLIICPFFLPYRASGSVSRLSTMISSFDVSSQETGLQVELSNMNGQKESEFLTNKTEQFQEYTRYAFSNPFSDETYGLDLYIFEKVKPTISDDRNDDGEADLSEIRVDVMLLVDSATKKTIKSRAGIFYKDSLIAEGSLENNSQIRITDDLSSKIKNLRLDGLKVLKNLLGSEKRSLDIEVGYIQGKKIMRQILNVSLLNMKQTPLPPPEKDDIEDINMNLDTVVDTL